MESNKNVLKWSACAAMALALISFFMPFVERGPYYTYTLTGYELITGMLTGYLHGKVGFLMAALIGSAVGLALLLVNAIRGFQYELPMIISIICVGCVWFHFVGDMDEVISGFWLFIIAHVASAVLCGMICANRKSSRENSETNDKEHTN